MATYDFATVAGTSIAFDPANDTLGFDAGVGSAGGLRFETLGFNLQVFLGGQWVILEGTSYDTLTSADFTFADGSLFLLGTPNNETLTGGAGSDWLDGRAGADAMVGGDGDDTYVLSQGNDTITEAANEGIDTVQSWLTGYALGANIENAWLRFNGNANAYGNGLDNTFYAGIGINVLSRGAGRDTVSYTY